MNKRLTTQSACGVWELERNDKMYTFTFTHNPKYPVNQPLDYLDKLRICMYTTYSDSLIHRTAFTVDNLHMRMNQFCKGIPLGIVESWVWDCLRPFGLVTVEYVRDTHESRKFWMPKLDTLVVVPCSGPGLYSYETDGIGNPFHRFIQ